MYRVVGEARFQLVKADLHSPAVTTVDKANRGNIKRSTLVSRYNSQLVSHLMRKCYDEFYYRIILSRINCFYARGPSRGHAGLRNANYALRGGEAEAAEICPGEHMCQCLLHRQRNVAIAFRRPWTPIAKAEVLLSARHVGASVLPNRGLWLQG